MKRLNLRKLSAGILAPLIFLTFFCFSQAQEPRAPKSAPEPEYVEAEVLVKFKEGADPQQVLQVSNFTVKGIERVYSIKPAAAKFKKDYKLEKDSEGWFWFLGKQYKEIDRISDEKAFQEAYKKMDESEKGLYRTYKIRLPEGLSVEEAVETLSSLPEVEYAEPNYIMKLSMVPNDPYYSSRGSWGQDFDDLWPLKPYRLNCEAAWDIKQGEGVTVAVIDTGVDYNHEDLSGNMWVNDDEVPANGIDDDRNGFIDDVYGYDFSWLGEPDPMDDHGHGSFCAGVIAAVGNNSKGVIGVAPKAKIMAVKCFDSGGSGNTAGIINGIRYAADNGAKVLNCSFAGPGTSAAITDALHYAHSKGCVAVAAAGNDYKDVSGFNPANIDTVIAVSGSMQDDTYASPSNFGERIDVAAPSHCITGTYALLNRYCRWYGTSFACAHASGIAALIFSKNPQLSNEAVRNIIRLSADDIVYPGKDIFSGYGRVNAYKALLMADVGVSLSSPVEASFIRGNIEIRGSAFIEANPVENFVRYELLYAPVNNPSNQTPISSFANQVRDGLLCYWDTNLCPEGKYLLTLKLVSTSGKEITVFKNVTIDNIDEPFEFVGLIDRGAVIGRPLEFKVQTNDPDDPQGAWRVQFSAGNLPPGAQFDPATQIFSWTPQESEKGIYQLTFTASDSRFTRTKAITIHTAYVEETRITDRPYSERLPAIYADKIIYSNYVWTGSANEYRIFLYNLTTRQLIQINQYDVGGTGKGSIYEDKIVWADNRNGNYDIFMYEISSGRETQITNDPGIQQDPVIFGNIIAWTDLRRGKEDIYIYDLSAHQETRISDDLKSCRSPRIFGNKIVFVGNEPNLDPQIYVYDLSSGQTTQITNASGNRSSPVINQNRIVWEDRRRGQATPDIYMYDLPTGQETCLTTDPSLHRYPDIFDNRIIWLDNREGGGGLRLHLYIYDTSTGRETKITPPVTTLLLSSAIYQDKVVWSEWRNKNVDIYMASVFFVPEITSVNPQPAPKGATLTITGKNFGYEQGSSQLIFTNGVIAKVISWSNTSITCELPEGVQSGSLKVNTLGGESNGMAFQPVNQPPELGSIGNKSADENQLLQFTVSATDPDNDTLTYSVTGLPNGANFNASTRTFSWTPAANQAGSYQVTFTVSDGTLSDSETITITVAAAPAYSLSITAVNGAVTRDSDKASYSSGESVTLTATPNTGYYFGYWSGDLTGTTNPATIVMDSNKTITSNFVAALLPPPAGLTATAISPSQIRLNWGDTPSESGFKVERSLDGVRFSSLANRQANITTYTNTGLAAGRRYYYRVRAFKGNFYSESSNIAYATTPAANRLPVANDQPVTTEEDNPTAITLSAADPDNDALTYSLVTPPSHGTLSGAAPSLTYTPALNYSGSDSFTFKANDTKADSNIATVSITVTPVNDAPDLKPIDNRSGSEGQLLQFTIPLATDPENNALTYSAVGLPAGASFNASTRTFSWVPGYTQAGAYQVGFRVSDGSLADSETITITVTDTAQSYPVDSYSNISYGNGTIPEQKMDVHVPRITTGQKLGIVIDIHAGYWSSGDKEDDDESAKALASMGFIVCPINYRLTANNEHMWPDPYDDCLQAVTYIVNNANDLLPVDKPGIKIDTARITSFGTSAGGHLASLLGTRDNARVKYTINCFGPSDLLKVQGLMDQGVRALLGEPGSGQYVINAYQASPIKWVSGDDARFLIVHGAADPYVPFEQSVDFYNALLNALANPSYYWMEGQGHALSDAGMQAVKNFLKANICNKPPVLNTIGSKTASVGSLLQFQISASDPNDDTLTYSANGLPSGATFNPSTRTFSWTPASGQERTYKVSFNVTDGDLSDWETVAIAVGAVFAPANIVSWTPGTDYRDSSEALNVSGYKLYRRQYGEKDWQFVHDNGNWFHFIDSDINPGIAYQYEVRPYTQEKELRPQQPMLLSVSPNYEVTDYGLHPENVLVLISTHPDALGYVDIAEQVPGYETANGKLDPITEKQLLAYLGYPEGSYPWEQNEIPSWHIKRDGPGGRIEAPLGVYYGYRRGIPKENIVFLDNMPIEERYAWEGQSPGESFTRYVIEPIKGHMEEQGITSKILAIVSVYHVPLTLSLFSWEDYLNYNLYQALAYQNDTAVVALQKRFNQGRHFSRILGDLGFIATRIDGQDIATCRRVIDDSIWAEENYHFNDEEWRKNSDLMAFIDWRFAAPPGNGSVGLFWNAAEILEKSGLFGPKTGEDEAKYEKWGARWYLAPDIYPSFVSLHPEYDHNGNGRLDNTFLRLGCYNWTEYLDVYDWARGAVAWNLDSDSAVFLRQNEFTHPIGVRTIWAANIINRGAAATLGAVQEPTTQFYTQSPAFINYLLNGYSFAEAAYFATNASDYNGLDTRYGLRMTFVCDPLYIPFKGLDILPKVIQVQKGVQIVERHILSRPFEGVIVFPLAYQDYDAGGRLTGLLQQNGQLIEYLDDRRTVVYKKGGIVLFLGPTNFIWIHDDASNLTYKNDIPGPIGNFDHDDIVTHTDGSVRILRYYKDRPDVDVFSADGFLLVLDPGTQDTVSASVIQTQVTPPQYVVKGHVTYERITSGDKTRSLITGITKVNGRRLEVDYFPDSFTVSVCRYYDASGSLMLTVSKNADNQYYIVRHAPTGSILSTNLSFYSPATLLKIIEPPIAPSQLTAGARSSNSIWMWWRDMSNNETGFKIWRKIANGEYSLLATVGPSLPTMRYVAYEDKGVQPGTTYYYKVCATSGYSDSNFSNEVQVNTPAE